MDNNFFNGQDMKPEDREQPNAHTETAAPQQDMYGQADMVQQDMYGQAAVPQQNMYGQTDMAQQNMYGQTFVQPESVNTTGINQPMYGGNGGSGKPPKGKKPMTKGKLAAIIGGSVAAIAAIVCGVIFIPRLFKSDREVVIDAFENTFETDTELEYLDELLGQDDIHKALFSTGGEVSTALSVNQIAGENVEGLLLTIDEQYDPVAKLVNATLDVAYQEVSVLAVNMIGSETNTYFQIEDFIDGYFSIPNDLAALENAPIFEDVDGTVFSTVGQIDWFPNAEGDSDNASVEIYSGYVDAIEGLWDSVSMEKQGNAKIDVNGKTVKAKEYYVTFSEADIEKAVSSVFDGVVEQIVSDPELLSQTGMDAETLRQNMELVKNYIPSIVTGDFVLKVYIKDDKVVKITTSDEVASLFFNFSYDFSFDIDDTDMSGKFSIGASGEEVGFMFEVLDYKANANGTMLLYMPGDRIEAEFYVNKQDTDAVSAVDVTANVAYNDTELANFKLTSSMNKADNSFSVGVEAEIDEADTLDVLIDGKYENINKGVGYDVQIENFDIAENGENLLNLSGNYSIDTSSVSANDIDSSLPVYDLSTLTDEEYSDIIMENLNNIMNWMDNFMNNAGVLGEALEEMLYNSYDIVDDYVDDYDYDDYDNYDDTGSYTDEDMTLVSGSKRVQILGCIDGFELDYACSYFVDYVTEADSLIEYSLYTNTSAEAIMNTFSLPSDDVEIFAQAENAQIDVEGVAVTYSMVQYDSYGYKKSVYRFITQIEEGGYLVMDASIYDDDDSYTVEQLAAGLGSSCYTILSE